jgi:hypothetical protein
MKEELKQFLQEKIMGGFMATEENMILRGIDEFFNQYQPERSKREDFCLTKLADQYLEEWEPLPYFRNEDSQPYIQGVYDFSDWLKQKMRCSEHGGNIMKEVQ